MKKLKYEESAENLAKATDNAINFFTILSSKSDDPEGAKKWIVAYEKFKNTLINAEPKFRNLRSLKYQVNDDFTFFQEGSGEDVNEFWRQIKNANLPYERVNRLAKILSRGKIINDIECDNVIDTMPALSESKIISNTEAIRLDG
tara:strand:- start:1689 stop:2123 length:435 start_codon:yes stop_codon:yes gene_type:complete